MAFQQQFTSGLASSPLGASGAMGAAGGDGPLTHDMTTEQSNVEGPLAELFDDNNSVTRNHDDDNGTVGNEQLFDLRAPVNLPYPDECSRYRA